MKPVYTCVLTVIYNTCELGPLPEGIWNFMEFQPLQSVIIANVVDFQTLPSIIISIFEETQSARAPERPKEPQTQGHPKEAKGSQKSAQRYDHKLLINHPSGHYVT